MGSNRVLIHRIVSWWLVVFAILTILSGYIISRHWVAVVDITFFTSLHLTINWSFISLLVFHVLYTLFFVKIKTLRMLKAVTKKKGNIIHFMRIFQQGAKWLILIFAIIVSLSGLNRYAWFAANFGNFISSLYHINLDGVLSISIILHVSVSAKLFIIRKKYTKIWANILIILLGGSLITGVIYLELPRGIKDARINIGGSNYDFDPEEIDSVYPEIFKPGSFSLFDILVYFDSEGVIEMEYHLNESFGTYIIDSINGELNWWYHVYYSGGFIEENAFRMDLFPWKLDTYIEMYQVSDLFLEKMYESFEEEVQRLENNNGSIIIPIVIIEGDSSHTSIYNVSVTAHNLRNDTFQSGVITAIDVILSLGDLSLLNYSLQWYDSLGKAAIVRSYWVESINNEASVGRCGFGYESGEFYFEHKNGNYINVPSDWKVLTSPEYIRFFWHCL